MPSIVQELMKARSMAKFPNVDPVTTKSKLRTSNVKSVPYLGQPNLPVTTEAENEDVKVYKTIVNYAL